MGFLFGKALLLQWVCRTGIYCEVLFVRNMEVVYAMASLSREWAKQGSDSDQSFDHLPKTAIYNGRYLIINPSGP